MKKIHLGGNAATGKYVIIDDRDFELINKYTWHLSTEGSAATTLHLGFEPITHRRLVKQLRMHRLIMAVTSVQDHVDHINHNRLDNRRSNLRVCTQRQNNQNIRPTRRNKSGYKGVCAYKSRWRAYITPNKRQMSLGCFGSKDEAARAYNHAATEFFGEFAYLNTVPDES
ncbi:HNH endonuclease [Nakamurella panacisegetis]|nr:HNH endonuclease [Nakamurella panacisegetis]